MTNTASSCSRLAATLILAMAFVSADASTCSGSGVELQVLGSGGPERVAARAASSYLVRQEGKPRVLVDIGGGSAVRFGESGARVADLDLILLTHLHVDHAGDLPALVKSSYFEERHRPLPLLGPGAGGLFPSTTDFLLRLFGPSGAFAYLGDFLVGDDGPYALRPQNVQPKTGQVLLAFEMKDLKASAAALRHGTVPALGWRLDIGAASIAFSGDTDGSDAALVPLSRGVDLWVAHNAVPEDATGAARALHMPPSVIGRIARDAAVGSLVLSHRMTRTLGREDETRNAIARVYTGKIAFADDLDCFAVGPKTTNTPKGK